jgi:regulator of replication initiation timing
MIFSKKMTKEKEEIKEMIKKLESEGFMYYICGMVIHYGKRKYDKTVECDYCHEIGKEIDFKTGFIRIMKREGFF